MADYPSQGIEKSVSSGSQSTAPDAPTTPTPYADPRGAFNKYGESNMSINSSEADIESQRRTLNRPKPRY